MSQTLGQLVFISYSRKDDAVMRRIAFHLRDKGFKIWVDNEKLIPGTADWEEAIEGAIKNAFIIIVVLSPDSKGSEWVRREITYADQFNKRIFPVLVRGDEELSLPLRLITRQFIDLRTDEEAGLNALSDAIKFYVENKQTLEMKRPPSIHQIGSSSHSVQRPKKTSSFNKWLIPTGIILAILIFGMVWAGSRIFGSPTASGQSESVQSTPPTLTEPASVPTEIISPTNTDIPTPSESLHLSSDVPLQYLDNVKITKMDTFDEQANSIWQIQSGEINNGMLEIVGNDNWDGAWYRKDFKEGEGFILDFRFTKFSTFVAMVNYGAYLTESYRRFGVYFEYDSPLVDVYQGADYIWSDPSGNLTFNANKTYSLMIVILPDGELLEVMWDPDNLGETFEYRNKFGETWAGLPWTLLIQANKGTLSIDNFQEITFSGEN